MNSRGWGGLWSMVFLQYTKYLKTESVPILTTPTHTMNFLCLLEKMDSEKAVEVFKRGNRCLGLCLAVQVRFQWNDQTRESESESPRDRQSEKAKGRRRDIILRFRWRWIAARYATKLSRRHQKRSRVGCLVNTSRAHNVWEIASRETASAASQKSQ